ncbi:hypothetical protein HNP81_002381 [Peribacillus huizhouensis]|uniref:Uncharacterized protein n=1 Tax=Peribacillus huizhouensis TaxID=1501239 RepID=A0ABR6CPX9_9BACI|nr:hypothetical protein [Peribacillus huizhouensis]
MSKSRLISSKIIANLLLWRYYQYERSDDVVIEYMV